jgi:ribosome modulation factor
MTTSLTKAEKTRKYRLNRAKKMGVIARRKCLSTRFCPYSEKLPEYRTAWIEGWNIEDARHTRLKLQAVIPDGIIPK